MDETDTSPEAREVEAYVLGQMTAQARAEFEARILSEPGVSQTVMLVRSDLLDRGVTLDEATEHASVLGHFKRELWDENRQPWHKRLRIWEFALGGAAAALVAYGAMSVGVLNVPETPETVFEAQLMREEVGIDILISVYAEQQMIEVTRRSGAPGAAHVFELWLIAEGATAYLGALPNAQSARVSMRHPVKEGALVAISREPSQSANDAVLDGAILARAPLRGVRSR